MKLKALCLFVIVVVGSLELSSTEVIVASYYGGCSPTLTCGTASISSGSLLIYNRTGIAQSFIPNYTCNLTAIHVYLDTGSGSKEITFSIRTEPNGTVLLEKTESVTGKGQYQFNRIDFDTEITIESNRKYWLNLVSEPNNPSPPYSGVNWWGTPLQPQGYPNNNWWNPSQGNVNGDLYFTVYGDDILTTGTTGSTGTTGTTATSGTIGGSSSSSTSASASESTTASMSSTGDSMATDSLTSETTQSTVSVSSQVTASLVMLAATVAVILLDMSL